ncbi:uncharacterized protein EDB91DRAFT_1253988 [Suillus paluster]|uniref:uncharacterized protein n=1 Tax=Suillus paluster TaxID=48578 RepID=UPI001B87B8AD|nr:uncharacterized protein EDB91DRAFT_1253988 [Suillus paluster]KAG1727158.1 hypothetical protein EDB91DRAFT_1253988 [Suillus paluster]
MSFDILWVDLADLNILVKGEDAGTWMNPDVGVLQKYATPSPFGRGEEPDMNPSYRWARNRAQSDELAFTLAQTERFGSHMKISRDISEMISRAMFVGKKAVFKLYKLAIYGEGGHFDWHRDSTHSDAHHGTSDDKFQPVVVAFYTDTEHKVMPMAKEFLPAEKCWQSYEPLSRADFRRQYIAFRFNTTYPNLDQKLIQAVVDEIRELHKEGTTVVAFPLTHLYHKTSIKKEYLKGSDLALFDALESRFDIVLHPVIIRAIDTGRERDEEERFLAYKLLEDEEQRVKEQCKAEGLEVEE